MKILKDEIRKRYEERRSAKTSLWSNWIVKIILLIVVLMVIRYFGDIHLVFQKEPAGVDVEVVD